MQAIRTPLILYIPGLLPKPEASAHKDALFRCLLEGVRRVDPAIARDISAGNHSFDLVSWTYDFYREHRDIAIDAAAIDAVIEQQSASESDIAEATSWARRASQWLYRLGDMLPFLIPHLANERVELHLRDLRRYTKNDNGIAKHARDMLKLALSAAWESDRPILLVAHSMGSVIAYDCLWEMTHEDDAAMRVDLLLTMGSPLGQNYLQRRIKGCNERGVRRYPKNIRRWVNLAAISDMTALDPTLADDFAEMLALGLVECIDDRAMYNHFWLDGHLNAHAEYGYLANDVTGKIIADWWATKTRPSSA